MRTVPFTSLQGKTVAFLVAPEGVEQVELTNPWTAVLEAGGKPRLVSTRPGRVHGYNHLDRGDSFAVDDTLDSARVADYDALEEAADELLAREALQHLDEPTVTMTEVLADIFKEDHDAA